MFVIFVANYCSLSHVTKAQTHKKSSKSPDNQGL